LFGAARRTNKRVWKGLKGQITRDLVEPVAGGRRLQAIILAGGEGTRLKPLTEKTPKAMITVAGKPFLHHQINLLKRKSIVDLLICIGLGGEIIRKYFGDGQSFGVRITYSDDGDTLLGTAGCLKKAKALLAERFFLTFGDAYPILDYEAASAIFLMRRKLAMMVVNKNADRYGRSNTIVQDGLVTYYSKKEMRTGMDHIEFGVTFMHRKALDMIPDEYPLDLEVLYRRIIAQEEMAALNVDQRIYDIGSPKGLTEFRELADRGQLQL
jgi:NDP-sugar pyrophosphorylase family protein